MDVFGRTAWYVRHYKAIRLAVVEKRAGRPRAESLGVSRGKTSDVTADEAIRNLTPLLFVMVKGQRVDRPEEWIAAVEEGLSNCTPKEADVLRAHLIEGKSERVIVSHKGIRRETLYARQNKAIAKIAVAAARRGLLDSEDLEV